MRDLTFFVVGLTLSLSALPVRAQTPTCGKLKGDQRATAKKLLDRVYVYDCCDETISACLKKKKVCRLAVRLADNICRRIEAGQAESQVERAMQRRASGLLPPAKAPVFDLKGAPMVGSANAPVTVVEYACARCPFCGRITPALHQAIENGPLKGKVRLYFRPFPIRYHKFAKEANMGLMAAARLGKFWPFMKKLFADFDGFSCDKQNTWAEQSGMNKEAFMKAVTDAKTKAALVASKKEGLRNKVDATPAFFVNGRKYKAEHILPELIDVLEEEVERVKGLKYR